MDFMDSINSCLEMDRNAMITGIRRHTGSTIKVYNKSKDEQEVRRTDELLLDLPLTCSSPPTLRAKAAQAETLLFY